MSDQHTPPSEQSANSSWRLWATVGVVSIAALAAVLGFVVLPSGSDEGHSAMAEAMGEASEHDIEWQATIAGIAPPTQVAWTRATVDAIDAGDAEAGATLAGGACASCHGADGISTNPGFPSLAGQPATATYKQLHDFASGNRPSPIMAGMAMSLSEQQIIDLAQFYSEQERPAPTGSGDGDFAIAEELALNGDPARGLPACDSCHAQHGPEGTPYLDGLGAPYVALQLHAFADGARGNDIYGLMRSVAAMLTDEEIDQLAAYYGI